MTSVARSTCARLDAVRGDDGGVNAGDDVLALRDVSVRFGRRTVLSEVTVALQRGEVVGLRGANGSGKTTLLRVLAGVLRPSSGVRVQRPSVAFVPAAVMPPPVSAEHWLVGVRRHRSGWSDALEQLCFDGDRSAPCRVLSLGNFRKVLLADALTSGADVVVLDEATVGLDDRGRAGVITLVEAAARLVRRSFNRNRTPSRSRSPLEPGERATAPCTKRRTTSASPPRSSVRGIGWHG